MRDICLDRSRDEHREANKKELQGSSVASGTFKGLELNFVCITLFLLSKRESLKWYVMGSLKSISIPGLTISVLYYLKRFKCLVWESHDSKTNRCLNK